jgi:hypothetical protein
VVKFKHDCFKLTGPKPSAAPNGCTDLPYPIGCQGQYPAVVMILSHDPVEDGVDKATSWAFGTCSDGGQGFGIPDVGWQDLSQVGTDIDQSRFV